MHFLRYIFTALIATSAAVAQLPPFRFIGLPERHSPTGQTILMNDRILIYSDDETSTWDQKRQRHYIYHRSTGKWSPLPNLDTLSGRRSIKTLNDSLILVNIGPYSEEFVIWNVDTDRFVIRGEHTRFSEAGLVVQPSFGCVQLEYLPSNLDELRLIVTSIPDGTVDVRTIKRPAGTDIMRQIFPHADSGFWLCTGNALWWTERFDTYAKVMDMSPTDQLTGGGDGIRIHVWSTGEGGQKNKTFTFTSPTKPPVITDYPDNFTNYIDGVIDSKYRIWGYKTGVADGFYVASSETPDAVRYGRFDLRTRVSDIYVGPRSWMSAITTSGLMISEDEGDTWRQVELPHRTYVTIDSLSSIQPIEGGGVTITAVDLYQLNDGNDEFDRIGTDVDLRNASIERWYRRDGSWLGLNWGRILVSDPRGITDDPDGSTRANASAFVYNDTVFVRWTSSVNVKGLNIGPWNPNSTSLLYNYAARWRFEHVYTVKELSNGTWFGGSGLQWAFSPTRKVEDIKTARMTSSLCPGPGLLVHANERPDSLIVLAEIGMCYAVIAHPLSDLSSYTVRSRGLPLGYFGDLIKGHDQQSIGILSDPLAPDYEKDSVYILDAEMMSAKVRRFENITEDRVFDIAYDDVNRVYYALTARGLYRSDPVVSSVASDDSTSDVHRPTSGVPLQTSWYNTLGEHVSPPTTPGLYLKIMIDDTGRMVTEKVAIP